MSVLLDDIRVAQDTIFCLNGRAVSVGSPPGARLSEVLRETCGVKDVKVGCNAGDCGACSILLDGNVVCACITPLAQAEGRRIETLAGLVRSDAWTLRLADSLQRHGGAQCGVCTPGVMVAATALLRADPTPDEAAVRTALSGVLCRCTGYRKIIDAVLDASGAGPSTAHADGNGHVGAALRRIDGHAKVHGEERFGDDDAPHDSLVVRVVRSPFPHAAFIFGDLDGFKASHPGLELVLTAADVPGSNCFGVIPAFADQPVFAQGVARFRGEAVAAVVGEAQAVAALDLSAFPVTFEPLPAVTTVAAALSAEATLLHPGRVGNVMCGGLVTRGDCEAGFADAAAIVEGDFETGFVEHAYIEPEAGFARRVGERIEIHACTQAPYMDRDSMAGIMGLDPGAVRIVPTAVGGGFGSKLDLSVQPYIALAAWMLNRPVRIAYTRTESMQSTTKRHPSEIRLKIGASAEGRITAFHFTGDFNTGAYASWGPTVASRVPVHASGPYLVPNYRAESRAVHTHCPPSGAFRGFGVPQSAVAQECLFDELADRLGIDRLEFRRINALRNGEPTVCGQVFDKGVGIGACLDALAPAWDHARAEAKAFNVEAERDGLPLRRGVGLASGWYGCGNTSLPNPSTIKAGIRADGALVLHQGATDIGQGSNTVIAQIFATAFGVPVAGIAIIGPDTDLSPDAGKTSASRQTFVTGNAARLAGEALRTMVLRLANVSAQAAIELGDGMIHVAEDGVRRSIELSHLATDKDGYVLSATRSYDPPTKPLDANGQGCPYAVFGYAAHLVELEVDLELGTTTLLKFTAAHDVGKAINPILVEGQVQGGIAQGVGMALMEEYLPGRTENLHDYLIPTIGDIPPIETLIVEAEDAHGPYGAKGLGEHVLIPTAPAILNAIRDACGARIRKLPATPERVLAAIRAARTQGA